VRSSVFVEKRRVNRKVVEIPEGHWSHGTRFVRIRRGGDHVLCDDRALARPTLRDRFELNLSIDLPLPLSSRGRVSYRPDRDNVVVRRQDTRIPCRLSLNHDPLGLTGALLVTAATQTRKRRCKDVTSGPVADTASEMGIEASLIKA
jgi:hypothetical protein